MKHVSIAGSATGISALHLINKHNNLFIVPSYWFVSCLFSRLYYTPKSYFVSHLLTNFRGSENFWETSWPWDPLTKIGISKAPLPRYLMNKKILRKYEEICKKYEGNDFFLLARNIWEMKKYVRNVENMKVYVENMKEYEEI